jgi:cytochrome b pre-mRNA-processing protein 6
MMRLSPVIHADGDIPQQRIYHEVFSRWPGQALRPDYQLQDVVRKAVDKRFESYTPSVEKEELFKARCLQYLQQNRWQEKYKLTGPMLEPNSQPTYFTDLVREIEEAPKRTWLQRMGLRLSGMIRMS